MSREILFRAWTGKRMLQNVPSNMVVDYPIMQYIGKTDRKGTKIYEGDVVKAPGEYPAQIGFLNGTFTLQHRGYNGMSVSDVNMKCYDVIGNIYQNPEMVKEY